MKQGSKNKILVIGSAGYIGGNFMVSDLTHKSNVVTGMDSKDGTDFLFEALPGQYDAVVFLATDMDRTQEAFDYNKQLFERLKIYVERYPDVHVIYSSSAAVYPDEMFTQSELDPTGPVNLYGEAKLMGERYVQQFKNHTILRFSNVYGSDEGGEGHGLCDLLNRKEVKCIYGDGSNIRDYVPVRTIIKAINAAVNNPESWRGITNVSSGVGVSVKALCKKMLSDAEFKKLELKPARKGDVQCSVLDNFKMRRLLNE